MTLRRSLAWTTGGQIVLFAAQMAAQVVVARHLSPYLVGISAIAFSICDMLNLMQTFGLRNFLVREAAVPLPVVRTVFGVNLVVALATAGVLAGLALIGGAVWGEARVGVVLGILAVAPVVMAFELVPGAMMQREMAFGAIAAINGLRAVVSAGVTVALVLGGGSYASMGWGALAGMVAGALATMWAGRRYLVWRPSLAAWRQVARFGLHMAGIGGASNLAQKAVDLIIGRVLGLAALGLFSRASALNNVVWGNIHVVFTRVVFAAMAEERRQTGSIRAIYLRTVDLVTACLWPAFAGLAVLSGPVVRWLYGPGWDAAGPVLALMAVAAIGLSAVTMAWEVFVVCGATGTQVRIEAWRAGLLPVMTVAGAMLGLRGAAAARVVDAAVAVALYRGAMGRLTETRLGEVAAIWARNAVLAGVAVAPAVCVMAWARWAPGVALAPVAGAVLAGVGLWGLAARWLNPALAGEIGWLVARVRRG